MNIRIRVPKRINGKTIVKAMLLFVCFERLLETIGFPHSIIFLLDFMNILLFLQMCMDNKVTMIFRSNMVRVHLIIFLIGIIVSVLNGVRVVLIIWALRNLLRFYIFFGACCAYLKIKDVYDMFNMFEKIFIINFIILLIQFAIGYRQDFLGGIFGSATGANAYSNIFILLVCAYSSVKYFEKKEKFSKFFSVLAISIIIAVVTETKILFFEVAFVVTVSIVIISIMEKKYKTLIKGSVITFIIICIIMFGAKKMAELYPSLSNSGLLSVDGILYILTRESGYTGYGDLNRLTAIETINKIIPFNSDFMTRFWGMGLGSTEYSTGIATLQSSFYHEYEYLHYFWFSHAWMYLECGYLGLYGYILGFFLNIPHCVKKCKREDKNSLLYVIEMVCILMIWIIYIYNQSLRLESAFLLYFVFAIAYIGGRE